MYVVPTMTIFIQYSRKINLKHVFYNVPVRYKVNWDVASLGEQKCRAGGKPARWAVEVL